MEFFQPFFLIHRRFFSACKINELQDKALIYLLKAVAGRPFLKDLGSRQCHFLAGICKLRSAYTAEMKMSRMNGFSIFGNINEYKKQ
jgi:hypothetical protein